MLYDMMMMLFSVHC